MPHGKRLDLGASDEGAPGVRARYAPDFYAAHCPDPEGPKLCSVHTGERAAQGQQTGE